MKKIFARKVNILGTEYKIHERSVKEDKILEECDGYCDWTARVIVVEREIDGSLGNMVHYMKKVLRHEIVHAFLVESGLDCSSLGIEAAWARNEEMVDWIARQGEKIYAAWKEVGALEVDDG